MLAGNSQKSWEEMGAASVDLSLQLQLLQGSEKKQLTWMCYDPGRNNIVSLEIQKV